MRKVLNTLIFGCACSVGATSAVAQQDDSIPDAVEPVPIDTNWHSDWRLRGAFQFPSTTQRGVETEKELLDSRRASPFVLSFNRDEVNGKTSTSVKGALYYTWRRNVDDGRKLKIINYAAGVELNQGRIDGVASSDTIKFQGRAAALFQNTATSARITNHFVDAGIGWITNSDFDLSVVSLDGKYTPLTNNFGRITSGDGLKLIVRPSLLVEAQKVLDAAGVTAFEGDADRLYAGVHLDVDAGFGSKFSKPLDQLSLGLDYTYMFDMTGRGDDRDLLNATASWALSDDGLASLNVTYSKGQSTSSDPVDSLSIGLGLAF